MKYLDELLKQEIYNQYMDQNLRLSYKDLANKYKICEKTVYNIIKQYGGTKTQNAKEPKLLPKQKPLPKQKSVPRQQIQQIQPQISETTNKFGSSELGLPYVKEPTPGKRSGKVSEQMLEIAKESRQAVVDKGEVSEFHYDDVQPIRTPNEPVQGTRSLPNRQESRPAERIESKRLLKPLDISKYNKPTVMPADIKFENI
jgi:hypothetical protein